VPKKTNIIYYLIYKILIFNMFTTTFELRVILLIKTKTVFVIFI